MGLKPTKHRIFINFKIPSFPWPGHEASQLSAYWQNEYSEYSQLGHENGTCNYTHAEAVANCLMVVTWTAE